MASEPKDLLIRLEIDKFFEFSRNLGQHRTSAPLVFRQLTWKLSVVNGVNCFHCIVQCNGNHTIAPDWSCVANVACIVPGTSSGLRLRNAQREHTFNAKNNECGLVFEGIPFNQEDTLVVQALIYPSVIRIHSLSPEKSLEQFVAHALQLETRREVLRNSIMGPKIGRVEIPSEKYWNVAEGPLEFGENGLVTTKDSDYGVIRAMETLPSKQHGILHFELKIIKFPYGRLQLGISQKANEFGSFYIFTPIYELANEDTYQGRWKVSSAGVNHNHDGSVIGCGVKMSKGNLVFTNNGKVAKTAELSDLKLDKGVDLALAVKIWGPGCRVQLSKITMIEDEDQFP